MHSYVVYYRMDISQGGFLFKSPFLFRHKPYRKLFCSAITELCNTTPAEEALVEYRVWLL